MGSGLGLPKHDPAAEQERLLHRRMRMEAAQLDSPFFDRHVFPEQDARIRQELKSAKTLADLLRAQGKLLLLDDIKDMLAAAKKPPKG